MRRIAIGAVLFILPGGFACSDEGKLPFSDGKLFEKAGAGGSSGTSSVFGGTGGSYGGESGTSFGGTGGYSAMSGYGGESGTSFGGTAGTSAMSGFGGDGGTASVSCIGLLFDSDGACGSCMENACCSQIATCGADANCVDTFNCVQNYCSSQDPFGCAGGACNYGSPAYEYWASVQSCLQSYCSTDCASDPCPNPNGYTYGSAQCDSCVASNCCERRQSCEGYSNCANDYQCARSYGCITGVSIDSTCMYNYCGASFESNPYFASFVECTASSCEYECSGGV